MLPSSIWEKLWLKSESVICWRAWHLLLYLQGALCTRGSEANIWAALVCGLLERSSFRSRDLRAFGRAAQVLWSCVYCVWWPSEIKVTPLDLDTIHELQWMMCMLYCETSFWCFGALFHASQHEVSVMKYFQAIYTADMHCYADFPLCDPATDIQGSSWATFWFSRCTVLLIRAPMTCIVPCRSSAGAFRWLRLILLTYRYLC